MGAAFTIERTVGGTAEFHAREPEPFRQAVFHSVTEPTLVLGSAQRAADVDRRVADALGVAVVPRRSGGGAVLLVPNEFVWLDLVIGADDPLWVDDVGRAMHWVGDVWCEALRSLGVDAEVHHGGLLAGEWGRQVCFAGVGAGEVMAGGAKLVGISQRRTRTWARFQSMVHLRFRPELAAALVASPRPTAAALVRSVACVDLTVDPLESALVDALARRR